MPRPDLALALGLLISLALSGYLGLTPGGLVVPGYLSLQLRSPENLLIVLVTSLLTYAVVQVVSRWTLLFGARRFVLCVLLGLLFTGSRAWLSHSIPALQSADAFGFVVPGLLASWMDRQGILPTLSSVSFVAVLVALAMAALTGGAL